MNSIAKMDQIIIDIYDYISQVADVNLDEKVDYITQEDIYDEEQPDLDIMDLRQRALQFTTLEIMSKYLKIGLDKSFKKRKIILYMFYEIYNYNFNYSDEELPLEEINLIDLYNKDNNDVILSDILKNNLLTPIIDAYMYITDTLYSQNIEDISDEIDFTNAIELQKQSLQDFKRNEIYQQEQSFEIIPNIYKYTLMDINNIYLLASVDESTKLDMMYYNIFDIDENSIPSPTDIEFYTLFHNSPIFLEDLYLTSFIYFSCKEKSLGLTEEEMDLFKKISHLLTSEENLYIPNTYDGKLMLKAYLHMIINKEKINTNHKNTVEKCIQLTRKKIHPINTCFYK